MGVTVHVDKVNILAGEDKGLLGMSRSPYSNLLQCVYQRTSGIVFN
jgi:hypothetical protein